MYVSACNIQSFTSAHVVESFYIFTLQIYPKVHATELQKKGNDIQISDDCKRSRRDFIANLLWDNLYINSKNKMWKI